MTQRAREMLLGYRGVSLAAAPVASAISILGFRFGVLRVLCAALRLASCSWTTAEAAPVKAKSESHGSGSARRGIRTRGECTRKLRLPEGPNLGGESASRREESCHGSPEPGAPEPRSPGRRSRGLARWAHGSQREGTAAALLRLCILTRTASAPATRPEMHLSGLGPIRLRSSGGPRPSRLLPMAGHLLLHAGTHPSLSHAAIPPLYEGASAGFIGFCRFAQLQIAMQARVHDQRFHPDPGLRVRAS